MIDLNETFIYIKIHKLYSILIVFYWPEWWIKTHQLDHFEKAIKIKKMIEDEC